MSTKNVVLIAGVHGVSGRAAAEDWSSLPGTQVYGLSRRSAPLPAGVEFISADLLDRDGLQRSSERSRGSLISCSALISKSRLRPNEARSMWPS